MSILRHRFPNERWGEGGRCRPEPPTFLSYSVKVCNIDDTALLCYYLTRAPHAASSQVIQDECGAKSGNCLAEFVCVVVNFVFNFFAPVRGKQVFCWAAAEFCK